jgi:hypothetical protein
MSNTKNLNDFKKWEKENPSWKKYFYTFTEEEIQLRIQYIEKLSDYFYNKFNYNLYLIYGTLLGTIRDNDLIKWDYDIDLAYLSKHTDKKNIIEEYYSIYESIKKDRMFSSVKNRHCGHLQFFFPEVDNTLYDVVTSYIIDKKYTCIPGIRELDSTILIPLKEIKFREVSVFVPNKPEDILNHCFVNWKAPIILMGDKKVCHKQSLTWLNNKGLK